MKRTSAEVTLQMNYSELKGVRDDDNTIEEIIVNASTDL